MGSWPGTDVRETLAAARDLLTDPGDGADGLPYLPELPDRGPGADLVGRGLGLLVDLPVDLQPSGWRLTDRPVRDQTRTAAYLREDLDELAEAFDGWTGRLKLQVAGPWTLAASTWLPRGERVASDPGATRDLVDSLAEGVRLHLATVQRLVPGAQLVLQVDEPSLPAVVEGRLPTACGFGMVRAGRPDRPAPSHRRRPRCRHVAARLTRLGGYRRRGRGRDDPVCRLRADIGCGAPAPVRRGPAGRTVARPGTAGVPPGRHRRDPRLRPGRTHTGTGSRRCRPGGTAAE